MWRKFKLWCLKIWTRVRALFGSKRDEITCKAIESDECDCDDDLAEVLHRENGRYPPEAWRKRLRWTHGVHSPFEDGEPGND